MIGGTNNNRKILLFQYLKYLIKEIIEREKFTYQSVDITIKYTT